MTVVRKAKASKVLSKTDNFPTQKNKKAKQKKSDTFESDGSYSDEPLADEKGLAKSIPSGFRVFFLLYSQTCTKRHQNNSQSIFYFSKIKKSAKNIICQSINMKKKHKYINRNVSDIFFTFITNKRKKQKQNDVIDIFNEDVSRNSEVVSYEIYEEHISQ